MSKWCKPLKRQDKTSRMIQERAKPTHANKKNIENSLNYQYWYM